MASRPYGKLRIIGGSYRRRLLRFDPGCGIRPTPDRIRETLFNWLRDMIDQASCLDLFAGSGALGFEALSRGASRVVLVDQDIRIVQQLQANIEMLRSGSESRQESHHGQIEVVWSEAMAYLTETTDAVFDIIFLDPPFRDHALTDYCRHLENSGLLNSPAWIYLESPKENSPPSLPDNWSLLHSKLAGRVRYHLARRQLSQ